MRSLKQIKPDSKTFQLFLDQPLVSDRFNGIQNYQYTVACSCSTDNLFKTRKKGSIMFLRNASRQVHDL